MKTLASLLVALVIMNTAAMTSSTAFAETYLYDVLAKPNYYKSWQALLLGEKNVDYWLAQYSKTKNGPAAPGKTIKLGGARYQINNVCKTHECGDNMFYVLFAHDGTRAWRLLLKKGMNERFFGNPDEKKKNALRAAAKD